MMAKTVTVIIITVTTTTGITMMIVSVLLPLDWVEIFVSLFGEGVDIVDAKNYKVKL